QKVAALAALRSRLCLISGGPGTGKTRTVVQILALLLQEAGGAWPRIVVAAPTGKAAARLQETLRAARSRPGLPPAVAAALPTEVPTLHRLLGAVPGTATYRHHAEHPLPADVLVVDEASMVDLALMTRLLDAVPPDARVLLLGDKDQLASVEAGAVLAELGAAAPLNRFSAAMAAAWREVDPAPLPELGPAEAPLADVMVQLEHNHRFPPSGSISRVSRAVREGGTEAAWAILQAEPGGMEDGLGWRELPGRTGMPDGLREAVQSGYGPVFAAAHPEEALARLGAFRILAALREGPHGVSGLNAAVEALAREAGWVQGAGPAYRGRQILVTANDPATRLFNGDVGVLWPDETGRMAAWFPGTATGTATGVRRVAAARLPAHQTAYALTVHKSQGSEYGRVLLVLPDRWSPVLTRELVYTGLTRATRRTEVWARDEVFRAAVA
ncbi:MAG: exodeoxyribonuclease V subunit alpha, partial [Verrucomicrobiota bacterium]